MIFISELFIHITSFNTKSTSEIGKKLVMVLNGHSNTNYLCHDDENLVWAPVWDTEHGYVDLDFKIPSGKQIAEKSLAAMQVP